MRDRIIDNQFKGIFILILFILLTLKSIVADAQPASSSDTYAGFRAGFGTRAITVNSNIEQIHQNRVNLAGGRIGLVFGRKAVRTSLGLFGYYSTFGKTKGTIDLYTTDASVNFFPLSLIKNRNFRLEPYLGGGLAAARYKFYGFYLGQDDEPVNYSVTREPHLGNVNQLNASVSAGIVVKIIDRYDFVHFFSEVRYSHLMANAASNNQFENTRIQNSIHVATGLVFGAKR